MGAFSEFDLDRQNGGAADPFADQPFDGDAFAEDEGMFFAEQVPAASVVQQLAAVNIETAATIPESAAEADVADKTVNTGDTSAEEVEAKKRAEHEASEAKRKQEWEARVQAKKDAEQAFVKRVACMTEEEMLEEALKRTSRDTEKLVGRNLKECVTEHIQMKCYEDPAFLRLTLQPRKTMIRCFQYINRKAFEYIQDEMKANGFQPSRDNPVYAADVPDSLCYQWAEDYFNDPTVQEDQEKEEEFVSKPYPGSGLKRPLVRRNDKKAEKKKTEKKSAPKKAEQPKVSKTDDGQFSFDSMMNGAAPVAG